MILYVVIPAHNAAAAVADVVKRSRSVKGVSEVVVVDDGSRDNTSKVAMDAGAVVIRHDRNSGYGAAQKTGIRYSITKNADVVIMVHSDGQHSPEFIPTLLEPIITGRADVVSGSRFKGRHPLGEGMPLIRYIGNILLTKLTLLVTGTGLTETHFGFRAYTSSALEMMDLDANSDRFIFDTEMLLQIISRGLRLEEVSCPTYYAREIKSYVNIYSYGLGIVKALVNYSLFGKYKVKQ